MKQGSITPHRGRWRVRGPEGHDGKRASLGVYATEKEAKIVLAAALSDKHKRTHGTGLPFVEYAKGALDRRELDGVRGVASERTYLSKRIATLPFATIDIREIRTSDLIQSFRELSGAMTAKGKISRKTVLRCLAIVSGIFRDAIENKIVSVNPCVGVQIRKSAKDATKDRWTFLTIEEQQTFKAASIAACDRLCVVFAWGTGMRQGEQWNLELRDVHVDGADPHVVVRYGSKGHAPKSGKVRTIPLFGDALDAAREWLALLPTWATENPHGLMWPTRSGARRQRSKMYTRANDFRKVLTSTGIDRPVRWHDLRHTCAASLISGVWGRRWRLEEIRDLLGHSSTTVTEIYAHLGESFLKCAARETLGAPTVATPENVLELLAKALAENPAIARLLGVSGAVSGDST